MIINPFKIILIFVVFCLFGVAALYFLPLNLAPEDKSNSMTVSYTWYGASPEAIERQVTSPLESVLSTLSEVKKITSTSKYHSGSITLVFPESVDIDNFRFEVSAKIRSLYSHLPSGMVYPEILLKGHDNPNDKAPQMILQLSGNTDANTLYRYAENSIKPKLALIKGIGKVEVFGGNKMRWDIILNNNLLNRLGLTKDNVIEVLSRINKREQLGWIKSSNNEVLSVSVYDKGLINAVPNVIVGNIGGKNIHLYEVAEISKEEVRPESYFRINGLNTVKLVVYSGTKVNQLALSADIRTIVDKMILPETYDIRTDYDVSEGISEGLSNVIWPTGISFLIVLLTSTLVLKSFRQLLLMACFIFSTLSLSFLTFYALKIELNLYTVVAISVSICITINYAQLMSHHYIRFRNRNIISIFFGSILVGVATLSVIWLVPDENKSELYGFAIVALIVSCNALISSYWLVPAIIEKVGMVNDVQLDKGFWGESSYRSILSFLIGHKKSTAVFALVLFGLPFFMLSDDIGKESKPLIYRKTIGSDYYVENMKPWVDKITGGTLRLFVNYVYESQLWDTNVETVLYVDAGLPNHSTPEQMNEIVQKMERLLDQYKEINRYITHIENGQTGLVAIYFKKGVEHSMFPLMLKSHIVRLSSEMSGVSWNIYGVGQGFSHQLTEDNMPSYQVKLKGYNYDRLYDETERLKLLLEKHPRVKDVDVNRSISRRLYGFTLEPDHELMTLRNISMSDLYGGVSPFNVRPGTDISWIQSDGEPVSAAVLLRTDAEIWNLKNETISQNRNIYFKPSEVSTISRTRILPEIEKEDQQYIRNLSFSYMGAGEFGSRFLANTLEVFKTDLPLGYFTEIQSYKFWDHENQRHYELIGLAVLMVFIVGVLLFESFKYSFIMMTMIPLSFIGVFLIFYWTEIGFDQGGYVSFILLSWLAVNPVILIVTEYNRLLNQTGTGHLDAYLIAFRNTIVPVMLSLFTTGLGLIPFLKDAYSQVFWPGLSLGIIGGSVACLLAFLFIVPTMLIPKESKILTDKKSSRVL